MKETFVLTLKLFLFCAVVAGLLAGVSHITKPIIEENNQANFEASMREVLPEASSFEEVTLDTFVPNEMGVILESIYRADNDGYVASTVCSEGYGGDIGVMVGITADLKITQVKILDMSETPGLGANASNPKFIEQYNGLESNIEVVKNATPTGNQVAAISSATVTSKAVTKAVNTALDAAKQVKGEGKK